MLNRTFATACLIGGVAATAMPAAAQNQTRALQTIAPERSAVTGTMAIQYNSRSERSSSGIDVYDVSGLTIADLMVYNGTVQRTPAKQMTYSLKIDVFNPQNISQVAKEVAILRGDLTIDQRGRYLPEPGRMRLDVVKGQQFTSYYKGVIQGREITRWWEIAERLKSAQAQATKIYSRYVDGKNVSIEVKNPDPLTFEGVVLPAGPYSYLPETRVSGNFDYDYELGNWLTDPKGINLAYTIGDRPYSDKVTGSIRYVEEEGSYNDKAGKSHAYTGYYDYALRFNEPEQNNEQSFFSSSGTQDQDAFFSTQDQSKPGLYGRVYYTDSEDYCRKVKNQEGQDACVGPTHSDVYYDLKPVGLTYQQLAAWFKLEPLVLGPFTDE